MIAALATALDNVRTPGDLKFLQRVAADRGTSGVAISIARVVGGA
jgi:hypothetical protein